MSWGSFEPPPVKMEAFRSGSLVNDTAVAPVVSPGLGLVHWSGMLLVVSFVTVTW
jgi:hypothetical protein